MSKQATLHDPNLIQNDFISDLGTLRERAHSEYHVGHDLESMVREDPVAERAALEVCTESLRFIVDVDPTTRRVLFSAETPAP